MLVFFFPIFVCFFVFFFSTEKFKRPSFIRFFGGKKKTKQKQTGKKRKLFHSFIRKSSKMRKNELFRWNKKIWSLRVGIRQKPTYNLRLIAQRYRIFLFSRKSSFFRIFEEFRMNEWKSCFFSGLFFFFRKKKSYGF